MESFSDKALHLASRTLRKALRNVPLSVSRSISSDTLPIFIFHAVEESPKPYIRHLYDCHTPKTFEKMLDEILAVFKPLEDLSPEGILAAGADRFLVTFDDGLRSSYEVAAPILERKGIPAIHFLITDFLAEGAQVRVEEKFKASLLVDILEQRSSTERMEAQAVLASAGYAGELKQALMSVRLNDAWVYDRVAGLAGIDLAAYFLAERPYISHQEAADLVRRGFMLGAHSVNHPRLWELDLDAQVEQTVHSMRHVAQEFALPCRYFAFPYGNRGISASYYERTRAEVDLFFTTSGWGNRMNDRKVLHRVGLDHQASAVAALQCGWRPFPLNLVQ